jgi:hypothetical protein
MFFIIFRKPRVIKGMFKSIQTQAEGSLYVVGQRRYPPSSSFDAQASFGLYEA